MKSSRQIDMRMVHDRAAEIRRNWSPKERSARRGLPPDATPWFARLISAAMPNKLQVSELKGKKNSIAWSNSRTA